MTLRGITGAVACAVTCLTAGAAGAAAQQVDDFDPVVDGGVYAVAREASGSFIIAGNFASVGGVGRLRLARVRADGSLDSSFNPGANDVVYAVAVSPVTGQVVVAGNFTTLGQGIGTPVSRSYLGRLNANGTVDASFVANTNGTVICVLFQPDGKMLVGGNFTTVGGQSRLRLARLNHDGSVDATFNPGASGPVHAFALGTPGALAPPMIYVGGSFSGIGGGTGATPRQNIAALTLEGTVTTFDPGVNSTVDAMHLTPQGLLVGGDFTAIGNGATTPRARIARLNGLTGVVDAGFDPGANSFVGSLVGLGAGRILAAGAFSLLGGAGTVAQPRLGVLTADGTPVPLGTVVGSQTVSALWPDPTGGLLAGGSFTSLSVAPSATTRSYLGRVARALPSSFHVLRVTEGPSSLTAAVTLSGTTIMPSWVDVSWADGGTNYSTLGARYPVSDTVSIVTPTGVVPAGPNVTVRVRAVVPSGSGNGSQSILDIEAPVEGRELIENGDFSSGATHWQTFDLPGGSGSFAFNGGVMEFSRSGAQAVVLQQTGVPQPAGHGLRATLNVGNTAGVRRRFSVLMHDADFSDLEVCTFWLPPNSPLATYHVTVHPNRAWRNSTISIYAATVGTPGVYQVDDVSLVSTGVVGHNTTCSDPYAPPVSGPSTQPTLLINGDFASGVLAPWTTYGLITTSVVNEALTFAKQAGTPSGVVLQATGQAMVAQQPLRSSFAIANRSGTRSRVTVLLHDLSFSDLTACTFWLEPFESKQASVVTFAPQAWTNATVSFYPAEVIGTAAFPYQLDSVGFSRSASPGLVGTACNDAPIIVTPVDVPATERSGGSPD